VDLRHSFERALRATLVLWLLAWSACVTVKPQEKELLSDPAMMYGSGGEADVQEGHVLANREGSAGATQGAAGGCGCN
jgi:hypothetical protein